MRGGRWGLPSCGPGTRGAQLSSGRPNCRSARSDSFWTPPASSASRTAMTMFRAVRRTITTRRSTPRFSHPQATLETAHSFASRKGISTTPATLPGHGADKKADSGPTSGLAHALLRAVARSHKSSLRSTNVRMHRTIALRFTPSRATRLRKLVLDDHLAQAVEPTSERPARESGPARARWACAASTGTRTRRSRSTVTVAEAQRRGSCCGLARMSCSACSVESLRRPRRPLPYRRCLYARHSHEPDPFAHVPAACISPRMFGRLSPCHTGGKPGVNWKPIHRL